MNKVCVSEVGEKLLQGESSIVFAIKKNQTRIKAGIMAGVMATTVQTSAFAVNKTEERNTIQAIEVYANKRQPVSIPATAGIDVYHNDHYFIPTDVNGNDVMVFKTNGTNYIPLRPLANLLGFPIEWNKGLGGVDIDTKNKISTSGKFSQNKNKTTYETTLQGEKGISVYIDGQLWNPKDVNGNAVDIYLIGGTTYVPMRAICDLFHLSIAWDGELEAVFLGIHEGKPVITEEPVIREEPVQGQSNDADFMTTYYKLKSDYYYIDGYHDRVIERANAINAIVVKAGYHVEQLRLDLSDPILNEYYQEFFKALLDLQVIDDELSKYNLRDYLAFNEKTIFLRIENGTYTKDDIIAVQGSARAMEVLLNNFPVALANAEPQVIAQKEQTLNQCVAKIDNYVKGRTKTLS